MKVIVTTRLVRTPHGLSLGRLQFLGSDERIKETDIPAKFLKLYIYQVNFQCH